MKTQKKSEEDKSVLKYFTEELKAELKKVVKLRRKEHHPIVHRVSREYKLSRRTLFYMKEYSSKSNIPMTIIKESWKVLILASILSSIGGLSLRYVEGSLVTVLPLLIALPALNDMIGDFGTITASKFTTMLFFRAVDKRWWRSKHLKELFIVLFITSIISAIFIGLASYAIPYYQQLYLEIPVMIKVLTITMITSVSLFSIIFVLSVLGGLYFYKKKEDPNNFLIPITTSVADLGSLVIFSILVAIMF